MSLNLSAYPAIRTALFVRLDVEDLGVLRFSDFYRDYTISGETYNALGSLMNVSNSTTELKLSSQDVTITLSGIPSTNIDTVFDYKLKGSDVKIQRGIFDVNTGNLISVAGNPAGKFIGLVNNFSVNEEFDSAGSSSSVTIQLQCTSVVGLLQRKISGRITNPTDHRSWFPTDPSMDRVPSLVGANFNWGSPTR